MLLQKYVKLSELTFDAYLKEGGYMAIKLFLNREGRCNFRSECNFKHPCVCTTLKRFLYFYMWSEVVEQTKFSAQTMSKQNSVQKAVQKYRFDKVRDAEVH